MPGNCDSGQYCWIFVAVELNHANQQQPLCQAVTSNVTRSVRKLRYSEAIENKCKPLNRRRSSLTSSGRGQHALNGPTRSAYRRTSHQIDRCLASQSAPPPTASTSTYDRRPRTDRAHRHSRPPYFNAAIYVAHRRSALGSSGCRQLPSDAVLGPARRRPTTSRVRRRRPRRRRTSAARRYQSRCLVD